jgi:tetratricopeptide (TPR) repeat protein
MLRSIAVTIGALFVPLVWPATAGAHSIQPTTFAARVSASFHDTQDDQLAKQEAELREAARREPNNAAMLARLGYVLAMENKFEESAHHFEQALNLNPGDVEARRSMATDYWQLGQSEKARTNLETVLKTNPNDDVAKLLLGMVSEELGDHRRAAKLLGEVRELARQRPETIAALARANYSLGEIEKARAALQLLVGHPAGAQAIFQGGRLAAEFKDYETAEKMFLLIQTTYPDAGALNYNLALAQFSAKHYQSCEKTLLSSIGYGHGTPDAYALLGWTYGKEERPEEMLKAFEKAINMDPSNQAHFIDLGEALVEKKNYGTALEVAKEAVKRFPASSQAHRLKGSVELKMYLLTEALKSYTTATELDPNNSRAAMGLALTQWNMDRTEDAAKSFEEGVRKFPNDAFFLLKYALFLLNAPGERDAQAEAKIKDLLRRSNELDGTDAETHYQLGNLALKENNYDEALRELQMSTRLDPEVAKVHLLLARVYRRAGHEEEAVKETQLHRKLKEKEEQNVDATAAIGTRHP